MKSSHKLSPHIWIPMPLSTTYWGFCKFFHPERQNLSINVSVLIVFMFRSLSNLLLIDHDTRFRAVSYMDLGSGLLSLENFITALSTMERQPKLECIKGLKITEYYYALIDISLWRSCSWNLLRYIVYKTTFINLRLFIWPQQVVVERSLCCVFWIFLTQRMFNSLTVLSHSLSLSVFNLFIYVSTSLFCGLWEWGYN